MNTPGTIGGKNWRWRVRREALNPTVSSLLAEITQTYMQRLKPRPLKQIKG